MSELHWIRLTDEEQLEQIKECSKTRPQVIFKHSTRCAVSSMAKNRLEQEMQPPHSDFYYLDLIRYRSLSDRIAADYHVFHQSPQVLLIRDAQCIYEESHNGIRMEEIRQML
jgi:bacillithiol system protein YtxJ